jgi:hypothetical protein
MRIDVRFSRLREPHHLDKFNPYSANDGVCSILKKFAACNVVSKTKMEIMRAVYRFLSDEYIGKRREIYKITQMDNSTIEIRTPFTLLPTYLLTLEYGE